MFLLWRRRWIPTTCLWQKHGDIDDVHQHGDVDDVHHPRGLCLLHVTIKKHGDIDDVHQHGDVGDVHYGGSSADLPSRE